MTPKEAKARATILKAVAHPARIVLIDALQQGDKCVNELCTRLDLDQSVVSRHLTQLKRAGILTGRREGVRIIHHLDCPCILEALDCSVKVLRTKSRRPQSAHRYA